MTFFGGIKVIRCILHDESPFSAFCAFAKLSFFRYVYNPKNPVKISGYNIKYADYRLFYEVFIELFIKKDYYFNSENKNIS